MYDYHIPASLADALGLLGKYGGKARVIAGGTDLIVQLNKGENCCSTLVDISNLEEYRGIVEEGGFIKLGALCTHSQVAGSALVRNKASALAEAASSIGSPQIRNVGTIGGNIVSAQPAADAVIALTALGAVAEIAGPNGTKRLNVDGFFAGVGRSLLVPGVEILTKVNVPQRQGKAASSFYRLARRRSLALPVLNAAVSIVLSDDLNYFQDIAIAAGPVAEIPWRAREAEDRLKGSPVSEEAVRQACSIAAQKANPRDSLRGSAEYRREMLKVVVYRCIRAAVEKLGGVIYGQGNA